MCRRIVLCALAVLVAGGCAQAPDSLRVERVLVGVAVGEFEPFDRVVTNPDDVRDLERMVRDLPPAPELRYCAIAWGLRYRLTFAHEASPTLVAIVEADGCRELLIGAADRRMTTEEFWARLAGALGFYTRGNDLFPLPKSMRR